MSDSFDVLILCKDLFFSSQLHAASQRAQLTARTCLSQTACLERLSDPRVKWIVADVEMPGLDLTELRTAAGPDRWIVAFGPHVHVDRLEAAAAAGCDRVLTRGQAASQLDALLQSGLP